MQGADAYLEKAISGGGSRGHQGVWIKCQQNREQFDETSRRVSGLLAIEQTVSIRTTVAKEYGCSTYASTVTAIDIFTSLPHSGLIYSS